MEPTGTDRLGSRQRTTSRVVVDALENNFIKLKRANVVVEVVELGWR